MMLSFNDLPDELLAQIFIRVPSSSLLSLFLVCRRWHQVLCDKQMMRRLQFSIKCVQINMDSDEHQVNELRNANESVYRDGIKCLARSQRSFPRLLIDSANVHLNDRDSWQQLGHHLTDLQMIECTIKDVDLFALIGFCPHLARISINSVCHLVENRVNKRQYDSQVMERASKAGQSVRELDLSGCHSFGLCDALFVPMSSLFNHLHVLNLSHCKIVFHRAIIKRFYFNNENHWNKASEYVFSFAIIMHFLQRYGKCLQRIDLSNTKICGEHLMQVVSCEQLNSLKLLNIRHCLEINTQHVNEAQRIRPQLKILFSD